MPQDTFCSGCVVFRGCGIDHAFVKQCPGLVKSHRLASCAVAWVNGKHPFPFERRCQQQLSQIVGEDADSHAVGLRFQRSGDLGLHRWAKQAFICVGNGHAYGCGCLLGIVPGHECICQLFHQTCLIPVKAEFHFHQPLALGAAQGKILMGCYAPDGLRERAISGKWRCRQFRFLTFGRRCCEDSCPLHRPACQVSQTRRFRCPFRYDVLSPRYFIVRCTWHLPRHDPFGQWFESFLPRNGGACALLRLERRVDILYLGNRCGLGQTL